MKPSLMINSLLVTLCAFAAALVYISTAVGSGEGSKAVKIIVGEAADQNFRGKLAVAEVIRNRGGTKGFSSAKKDLDKFFSQQPPRTRSEARMAWVISRFTNVSGGADHFDNVKKFGEPEWAKGMKKTAVIDDMQYYRSR